MYTEIAHKLRYKLTTMEKLSYTTYISVDHAHHEIVHAKVGMAGINRG